MKRVLFLLLLSCKLCGDLPPLTVGTTSGYAPYVSLDQEGKYRGFDIDFASELAEKLGRRLVIKDCGNMPGLLMALSQKKIDLVIWAVSITDERLKKLEMIYYQGEKVTKMPLIFWQKIPDNITCLEDFTDKQIICVEAGSFQESVIKKYPHICSKQVEKITDALMEIRFGKSTAACIDPSLIFEITTKHPEIKVLYLPLKPEDYSLGNGIALNKDNTALAEKVRRATEELIQEGRVAALEKKWQLGA